MNEDSILKTIKNVLLGNIEDDSFDQELILDTNLALNTLTQIGVGPEEGFKITGDSEKWSDFFTLSKLEMIKEYIVLKVRLIFDPPSNSFVHTAFSEQLKELEWRINIEVDDEQGGERRSVK